MFKLSVTVSETFAVDRCTILTLTFRTGQGPICVALSVLPYLCFPICVALSVLSYLRCPICVALFVLPYLCCPICEYLRDYHVWTFYCTRFESLTLKIEVKNIENLDDNWQTNLNCQLECGPNVALLGSAVCSRWHFVANLRTDVLTHGRTNKVSRSIIPFNCAEWERYKKPSFQIRMRWFNLPHALDYILIMYKFQL